MRAATVLLLCVLLAPQPGSAQLGPEAAYARLLELTAFFNGGSMPYACDAIVEAKYKSNAANPVRDTSKLIYRDQATYYRSRLIERLEGPEGELLINHELKTVSLHLSDSIRRILLTEVNAKPQPEFETLLEKDVTAKTLAVFKQFLTEQCRFSWDTKGGMEEVTFTPKNPNSATLLLIKLKAKDSRVQYYEYVYRDVYATDYYGNSRFRILKTVYQGFNYDNVSKIPVSLREMLQWNGWTVKLKKYTDYKLSVL